VIWLDDTNGKLSRTRKLTEEQVEEIIIGSHCWADDKVFAERFKVGPHAVRRVRLNKNSWRDVRERVFKSQKH
jgi:hypothetical protein